MTAAVTICMKLALTSWFVCEELYFEFHEILTFGLVAHPSHILCHGMRCRIKFDISEVTENSCDNHVQNLKPSTLLQQTYCLVFITGCS